MQYLLKPFKRISTIFASTVKRIVAWASFSRCVSLVMMNCFLFSFVFAEAIAGVITNEREENIFQESMAYSIIPQAAGRITSSRYFGSKEVVINIQDLHCHSEVQKNIALILGSLDKKYKLNKIYLEGAFDTVDMSWLTDIQNKKTREELADALVDSGKLTGAEYYAVQVKRPDLISGLEDKNLYLSNLKRLGILLDGQETIQGVLEEIDTDIHHLTTAYYNKKQTKFDKLQQKYKTEKLNPSKYYAHLKRYSQKLGIDIYGYRNLTKYQSVLAQEQKLEYKAISRELQSFVALLRQKMTYASYQALAQKTENFSRLAGVYGELTHIYEKLRSVGAVNRYPRLEGFFAYVRESQGINPVNLVDEETKLGREINRLLADNESGRAVAFLADCVSSFKDYTSNKISANEYEVFAGDIDQFKRLWKIYADNEKLASLEPYFRLLNDYYETNIERNRGFVRTMFGALEQGIGRGNITLGGDDAERILNSLDRNANIKVMVTGGFHAEGVSVLLENAGISYLVITPSVTTGTKDAENVYRKLAQQQTHFAGQAFAMQILSQEPIPAKACTAAGAIAAACVLNAGSGASLSETEQLIREKIEAIGGLYSDVTFTMQNVEGQYAIQITYQPVAAETAETQIYYFDAAGKMIDPEKKPKITLRQKIKESLFPVADKYEDRDGYIGKFDRVRISEYTILEEENRVRIILQVLRTGKKTEEKVILWGNVQSDSLLNLDFARVKRDEHFRFLTDFLKDKINDIDDVIVDTVEFENGSSLQFSDILGIGIALNPVTGKALRILHQSLAENELARLHELLHIANSLLRRNDVPWVSIDDLLKKVTDPNVLEKSYSSKVLSKTSDNTKFHYAARAFQEQVVEQENRELTAKIRQIKKQDEEKIVTEAFKNYASVSREERVQNNLAFQRVKQAVHGKNQEAFNVLLSVLIVTADDTGNTLDIPDLTLFMHEVLKNLSRKDSVLLKKYMAEFSKNKQYRALSIAAAKVLRWIDVGVVVFVSPEAFPISKDGGLANVVGELPKMLAAYGLKTLVITPNYKWNKYDQDVQDATAEAYGGYLPVNPQVYMGVNQDGSPRDEHVSLTRAKIDQVEYILLTNNTYADKLYRDASIEHQVLRSQLLSYGALEAMKACQVYPSIIVGNDWMCALLMAALASEDSLYHHDVHFKDAVTAGWVHNNGEFYQLKTPRVHENFGVKLDLLRNLGLSDRHQQWFVDHNDPSKINFMQAYIERSKYVVAVSRAQVDDYVRTNDKGGAEGFLDIFRWLQRIHRLFGFVNGIMLDGQKKHFGTSMKDVETVEEKEAMFERALKAKQEARKRIASDSTFWGEKGKSDLLNENSLVISFVGRIVEQKGLDYAVSLVDRILEDKNQKYKDVVFLFGGISDDEQLMNALSELTGKYPGRVGYHRKYVVESIRDDVILSGDIFLAPSRFEPGGIVVMEALSYGAVPLASSVQGHKDSIRHWVDGVLVDININDQKETVNNFLGAFNQMYDFWVNRGNQPDNKWRSMVWKAIFSDHSWEGTVAESENLFKYMVTGKEYFYKKLWKDAVINFKGTVKGQLAHFWLSIDRQPVLPLDRAYLKRLGLDAETGEKFTSAIKSAFEGLHLEEKQALYQFQKSNAIMRHTGEWMEIPLPIRVEDGLPDAAAVTPHEIILNADLLRAPPEVLTLVLLHALRRSLNRFSPDLQMHDARIFRETLQYLNGNPVIKAAWDTWIAEQKSAGKSVGNFFGRDWVAPFKHLRELVLLDTPQSTWIDMQGAHLPVSESFTEMYRNQRGVELVHKYIVYELGDGIRKVIRFAPKDTKDWIANQDTSESRFSGNTRIDIVLDVQDVAAEIVAERKLFKEYPGLLALINDVTAGTRTEQWAAIDELRAMVVQNTGVHEKASDILFDLARTFPDSAVRRALNRFVFDRATGRSVDFPTATFNYSAIRNEPYTLIIPVQSAEIKILWSHDGSAVQEKILQLSEIDDMEAYHWQVPVKEGWVQYAVQVRTANGWEYQQTPYDEKAWLNETSGKAFDYFVNTDPRGVLNGLIKFQDVEAGRIMSIRPEVFNLRLSELNLPLVDDKGNMLLGTLEDLKKQLKSIRRAGFSEVCLQVLETGAPGEAGPDSSAFSALGPARINSRIGGMKGLIEVKAFAEKLGMQVSLDMIPHVSRSDRESSSRSVAWIYNGLVPVRRAAGDGGFSLSEWNDSSMRNWTAQTVREYAGQITELAALGFNFRIDVGHAFDTTFETDPDTVGMARLRGDITTAETKEITFAGHKRTVPVTYDLRMTDEPNAVLGWIIYEAKKAGRKRGHEIHFYSENWHGHETRLTRSGVDLVFDSVIENIRAIVIKGYSAREVYDTLKWLGKLRKLNGGSSVTVVANHDEQVPPVDAFGWKAFVAAAALIFINGGASFQHFHYAFPNQVTRGINWAIAPAEKHQIMVNNYGAARRLLGREWPGYNWGAKIGVTIAAQVNNAYLKGLGEFEKRYFKLIKGTGVIPLLVHHNRVIAAARKNGKEILIGLFNVGDGPADINFCPNQSKQEDFAGIEDLKNDAVYEVATVYNNEDLGVSPSKPSGQLLVTGREINNLGIGPRGSILAAGIQNLRIRQVRATLPRYDTKIYSLMLKDSLTRLHEKQYSAKDIYDHSFIVRELVSLLEQNNLDGFLTAMNAVQVSGDKFNTFSRVLDDIGRFNADLKNRFEEFMSSYNGEIIDLAGDEELLMAAQGGFFGKFSGMQITQPVTMFTDGTAEFKFSLRKAGSTEYSEATINGKRAPPENIDPARFAINFENKKMGDAYNNVFNTLFTYLGDNQNDFDYIEIDNIKLKEGSSITSAEIGGVGTFLNGKPLIALQKNLISDPLAFFHELAHSAHAAKKLDISDLQTAVDSAIWKEMYENKIGKIENADDSIKFHYALRAFQRQYFHSQDQLLSHKIKRFNLAQVQPVNLAHGQPAPQWAEGLRIYYDFLRDSVFDGDPKLFANFSELKKLADHVKDLKFNAIFLMPLGDTASQDKTIDDSPYALLSPSSLDPRYIDWKASGIEGATPVERWHDFSKELPAEFLILKNDIEVNNYADTKANIIIAHGIEGYSSANRITAYDKEQVFNIVMMEQYLARMQFREAVNYIHSLDIYVGIDYPYFQTMEGASAQHNREIFNLTPEGKILPAGWHLGDWNQQVWGDIDKQTGLGQYNLSMLNKYGYKPLLAPLEDYVKNLGIDFVRLDAVHMIHDDHQTHSKYFESLAAISKDNGILFVPETLGAGNSELLNEILRKLGFRPVENAGGGWFADGVNGSWNEFLLLMTERSKLPEMWQPFHHDNLRDKEFSRYFEDNLKLSNEDKERARRKKVLYALFGLGLPNYTMLMGDEFGASEPINIPGETHTWKKVSPFIDRKQDITAFIRDINIIREENPFMGLTGTLANARQEEDSLYFERFAPDGSVLKVRIDLKSGDYKTQFFSLASIPIDKMDHDKLVQAIIVTALGVSTKGEPWGGLFYDSFKKRQNDANFRKAFGDAMKVLLFEQDINVKHGAAWILSRPEFAGEVDCPTLMGWQDQSVLNVALHCPDTWTVDGDIATMYMLAPSDEKKQLITAQLLSAITLAENEENRIRAIKAFYAVHGDFADPVVVLKVTDPWLFEQLENMQSCMDTVEHRESFSNRLKKLLTASVSSLVPDVGYSQKTIMYAGTAINPLVYEGRLVEYVDQVSAEVANLGQSVTVIVPANKKSGQSSKDEQVATIDIPIGGDTKTFTLRLVKKGNVNVVFIEHDDYFTDPFPEDRQKQMEEAVILSRAPFEIARAFHVPLHIVHANSWQTGLIPFYLNTVYRNDPLFKHTRSVYHLYDLGSHGRFPRDLWSLVGVGVDPSKYFDGDQNILPGKAGIVEADVIVASQGYKEKVLQEHVREGLKEVLWTKEHQGRFFGIPVFTGEEGSIREQISEAYNRLYESLQTDDQVFDVNLATLISFLQKHTNPLMILLASFLTRPTLADTSDPLGIIAGQDIELSLETWLGHIWKLVPESRESVVLPGQKRLSFTTSVITNDLSVSLRAKETEVLQFSVETMHILRSYKRASGLSKDSFNKSFTVLNAIDQLKPAEKTELIRGLAEKYRGKKAPALMYLILLNNNAARETTNTIDLNIERIQKNLSRFLKKDDAGQITVDPGILRLLEIYAEAYNQLPDYPVEAAWPFLKAVVQLDEEQETALLDFIKKVYASGDTVRPKLIDALFLMNGDIEENWIEKHVPELVGRRNYYISAEISHWAGGLGPVMAFHGRGMKELGSDIVYIEPWYKNRFVDGKLEPIDYEKDLGENNITIDKKWSLKYDVKVGKYTVSALVGRGINKAGVPVYLIRDMQETGSQTSDSTKMVYSYSTTQNPVKWEEFTAFFSQASVELVNRLEVEREETSPKNDVGSLYKPAIIHTNDGQTASFAAIAKGKYSGNSVMSRAIYFFTTHTFKNRGIEGKNNGVKMFWDLLRIDHRYLSAFLRFFNNDSTNIVGDWTSLGVRLSDWVGTVSKMHRVVGRWDPRMYLVGVTNGAAPEMMARIFREKMLNLFSNVNFKRPTADQIMRTKEACKGDLNVYLEKKKIRSAIGRKIEININQILIGYARRLVKEKAGRERALTDENIIELVKKGGTVVLFGSDQGTDESRSLSDGLKNLERRISKLKEGEESELYSGNFFFVNSSFGEDKIALLSAMDIQVHDSDEFTGAAEYSEEDVSANGGLELSPYWSEGVIMEQGIKADFKKPGKGNTLIPDNGSPAAYLKVMIEAVDVWQTNRIGFYEHCATSMRLNRIQKNLLTSAAYLYEYQKISARKEREISGDHESMQKLNEWFSRNPDTIESILTIGRNSSQPFNFNFTGWNKDYIGDKPTTGSSVATSAGIEGFIEKKQELESIFGYDAVIEHFENGHYTGYLMGIFRDTGAMTIMDEWLRKLKSSPEGVIQKDRRFTAFMQQLVKSLRNIQAKQINADGVDIAAMESLAIKPSSKFYSSEKSLRGNEDIRKKTSEQLIKFGENLKESYNFTFEIEGRTIKFIVEGKEGAIGISDAEIGLLVKEAVDNTQSGAQKLPATIVIALLDKSPNLFEDHIGNGFIGINRAIYTTAHPATFLKIGLFHELCHEVTQKSGTAFEKDQSLRDVLFSRRIMTENKQGLQAIKSELVNSQHFIGEAFFNMLSIEPSINPNTLQLNQSAELGLTNHAKTVAHHASLAALNPVNPLEIISKVERANISENEQWLIANAVALTGRTVVQISETPNLSQLALVRSYGMLPIAVTKGLGKQAEFLFNVYVDMQDGEVSDAKKVAVYGIQEKLADGAKVTVFRLDTDDEFLFGRGSLALLEKIHLMSEMHNRDKHAQKLEKLAIDLDRDMKPAIIEVDGTAAVYAIPKVVEDRHMESPVFWETAVAYHADAKPYLRPALGINYNQIYSPSSTRKGMIDLNKLGILISDSFQGENISVEYADIGALAYKPLSGASQDEELRNRIRFLYQPGLINKDKEGISRMVPQEVEMIHVRSLRPTFYELAERMRQAGISDSVFSRLYVSGKCGFAAGNIFDIIGYYENNLKPLHRNIMQLLPLVYPVNDFPFESVNPYAADTVLIDWLKAGKRLRVDVSIDDIAAPMNSDYIDRTALLQRQNKLAKIFAEKKLNKKIERQLEDFIKRNAYWLIPFTDDIWAGYSDDKIPVIDVTTDNLREFLNDIQWKKNMNRTVANDEIIPSKRAIVLAQFIIDQQIREVLSRVQQKGEVFGWVDITEKNKDFIMNGNNMGVLQRWTSMGFKGIRLSIENPGILTGKYIAGLADLLNTTKVRPAPLSNGRVFVKINQQNSNKEEVEHVRQMLEKSGFILVEDLLELQEEDVKRVRNSVGDLDSPFDLQRLHDREDLLKRFPSSTFDEFYDRISQDVRYFQPKLIFSMMNRYDKLPPLRVDEDGNKHFDVRAPYPGDTKRWLNTRILRKGFQSVLKYGRDYALNQLPVDAYRVGSGYEQLPADKVIEALYDQLIFFKTNQDLLKNDPAKIQGFYAETNEILEETALWPSVQYISNMRKRMLALRADESSDKEAVFYYAQALAAFLRGVTEEAAAWRYQKSETVERYQFPENVAEQKVFKGLLSMLYYGIKQSESHMQTEDIPAEAFKFLLNENSTLAGRLINDDSKEELKLPAEPSVWDRTMGAVIIVKRGKTAEEVGKMIYPIYNDIMREGVITDLSLNDGNIEKQKAQAWVVSRLLILFSTMADRRFKKLDELLKESTDATINILLVNSIRSAA